MFIPVFLRKINSIYNNSRYNIIRIIRNIYHVTSTYIMLQVYNVL